MDQLYWNPCNTDFCWSETENNLLVKNRKQNKKNVYNKEILEIQVRY